MCIPHKVQEITRAKSWTEISVGCSAAYTFRLTHGDETRSYLKVLQSAASESLLPEYKRLRWLQGKLPVPKVLGYFQDADDEFLWISEIAGIQTADRRFAENLPDVMRLLAKGLHQIHKVSISDCPFHHEVKLRIHAAQQNVNFGLVDQEDFDAKRQGRTAADLFAELTSAIPPDEDLVFTHGDYCLPNVLIDGGNLGGFIDWGRAGVSDRYQDIALAVRSIAFNFGTQWADLFLYEYGLDEPDWPKIEWYQLLDEFF